MDGEGDCQDFALGGFPELLSKSALCSEARSSEGRLLTADGAVGLEPALSLRERLTRAQLGSTTSLLSLQAKWGRGREACSAWSSKCSFLQAQLPQNPCLGGALKR